MAKLEQVARAETDRGVSEVLWAPDGKQLIFNFHGQLYAVLPGQTPQRLIDSPATQGEAASSPRKNEIAYISGGDLWVVVVELLLLAVYLLLALVTARAQPP